MQLILTSILAFVSTNIDDLFILTLFFGNRKYKTKEIVTGQLLGIAALIGISSLGSLLGLIISEAYIGLLGLLPVYFGLRSFLNLLSDKEENDESPEDINSSKAKRGNILMVAGVTMANGGDNIGIYIPLFVPMLWIDKMIMIIIFLLMTVVWCIIARYFATHPYVAKTVDKYGHAITPVVLIALGIFILYENGTIRFLMSLI
jgi:cadmium resistance transport/sequestration family protein